MRFSVIIPVYNCGNVLSKCVDSIREQTFDDFELLLIDDGSTDGSASVCDAIAETDSRIKVLHQKNAGTSAARNAGLEMASGEYVAFLDNDDSWLRADVLERIDDCLRENAYDIICFKTEERLEDGSPLRGKEPPLAASSLTGDFYADTHAMIKTSAYTPAVWSKIIRLRLIRENEIRFPSGMRNEDIDFSCKLLQKAESISYIDEVFYGWTRGREQSQTSQSITPRIAQDLSSIISDNAANAMQLAPERRKLVEEFLSYPFAVWLTYSRVCDKTQLKTQWDSLAPYAHALLADGDYRAESVRKTARIIGVPATRWLASKLAGMRG